MKRLKFIAALFGFGGVAAAQHPIAGYEQTVGEVFAKRLWQTERPQPNECPLCGTMAQPFKPLPSRWCNDSVVSMQDGKTISGCDPSLLPKEQLVRCVRCNCAFWQDAK